MSRKIIYYYGNYFSEVAHLSENEPLCHRVNNSRISLENSLQDLLIKNPEAQIEIYADNRELLRRFSKNEKFALFTTAGFEDWPCIHPELISLRIPVENIFGLTERVDSKGSVVTPLQDSEVEFLISKLNLMELKHVAIGLIHSNKNKSHEKIACDLLKKAGFNVQVSHVIDSKDEIERWCSLVTLIQQDLALENLKKYLQEKLKDLFARCQVLSKRENIEKNLSGVEVYLGLDGFTLSKDGQNNFPLSIQPTSEVHSSHWGFPGIKDTELGYEPGPILMGRGHKLTFLDLLLLDQTPAHLPEVQTNSKLKSRIYDQLKVFNERHKEEYRDPQKIADMLLQESFQKIRAEILFFAKDSTKIKVTGNISPHVKEFLRIENAAFAEDFDFNRVKGLGAQ